MKDSILLLTITCDLELSEIFFYLSLYFFLNI